MSLPASPASAPLEAGFRAQPNREPARSLQLNIDADTIRRLRIRTARFPTSFATDELALRSEVSKSAYYPVLARAVSRLPNNTREARLALYDRAEIVLTAELLHDTNVSDERVMIERLAFERAILRIEGDAWKKENTKAFQAKRSWALRIASILCWGLPQKGVRWRQRRLAGLP
jgi:hypothetical protein